MVLPSSQTGDSMRVGWSDSRGPTIQPSSYSCWMSPAVPAARGVAMLVPEDVRKLLLLVFQNPSAAAEDTEAPGANKNIPSVPDSVGP